MFANTESRIVLVACALLTAASAFALSSDKNQPMDISSDHGEWKLDSKTNRGTGIYDGHVVITQGSIRITADHADVHTLNGELQTADVTGTPATFQQQPDTGELMHGVADRIHYNSAANTVDMVGHAHMQQGIREMSADEIHYNTETEHAIASGGKTGGRVHIVIPPKAATRNQPEKATPP